MYIIIQILRGIHIVMTATTARRKFMLCEIGWDFYEYVHN